VPYFIGTDEAGYGPNLGPLVITACVWEVPSIDRRVDLYRRLTGAVANCSADCQWGMLPLPIADSKALYNSSVGLGPLERSVLTCLGLLGLTSCAWQELWQFLEPARDAQLDVLPWHVDSHTPLPLVADGAEISQLLPALELALRKAKVRLASISCRTAFPAEFNELTMRYGNKAEALSQTTLALVANVLASLPPAPTRIVCDKHGGRNRYGPLLQQLYPDVLIEVCGESRAVSTYRWGDKTARREVQFMAGGEAAMPTALASMVSKYLRELAMHAFNTYWLRHLPELKPTAGYPGDSRRFKLQIAQMQQSLGIEDRLLWRDR
jgi:ribonuclease HII